MDYRKIAALALCAGLMFNLSFGGAAHAAAVAVVSPALAQHDPTPSFTVNAKGAVLMEPLTGKIILEHNSHEALPPASITKIMTLLLIYEAIEQGRIKWDDMVTTSEYAARRGGSQIYLEAGEQQSVRDLTKAIAIASANDAAAAMAEFLAGSEEGFVINMNAKAAELGMKNTTFINSCGLPAEGHEMSAHDIALMSRALITGYPEIHELATVWMDTITHRTARGSEEFGLTNTNRMLRTYQGANGLKTGFTGRAGFCISATAQRDGLTLIAVILGSPDSATRFDEARKLLDYGFANYAIASGDPAGMDRGQVIVNKGIMDSVGVVVREQISVIMPKGNHVRLDSRVELLDSLNAPVAAGTKAGEVIYISEGKEVGRSDLITAEDVERADLGHMMRRLLVRWFV